jgi:hypothetical protein
LRKRALGVSATLLAASLTVPLTTSPAHAAPVASPARARATVGTSFDDVTIDPKTINKGETREFTIGARLVSEGWPPPGVPGATVLIKGPGGVQLGDPVRTDAEGRLTARRTLTGPFSINLVYAGTDHYRQTERGIIVDVPKAATRLTVSPVSRAVEYGAKVPVSGLLEVQRNGRWQPLPSVRVHVGHWAHPETPQSYDDVDLEAVTDSGGRFRADPQVFQYGEWHLAVSSRFGEDYAGTSADLGAQHVRQPTAIKKFDIAPEPAGIGVMARYRFESHIKGTGWSLEGPRAALYFRPKGSASWRFVAWSGSPSREDATITGSVRVPGAGDWQARIPDTEDTQPSVSGIDHVEARYVSEFTAFNAAPEPVRRGRKITITGRLGYIPPAGQQEVLPPLTKKKVGIYFRAKGTKKWVLMGTAMTGPKGGFSRNFTARRDGYWRAKFAGGPNVVGYTGWSDYVDVR